MPETLKQVAYAHVRRKIIAGEFGADGRVSEWAVSRELKISRGPIREAVNQLASEGLLTQTPHVGTFVHTPDRAEIEQLCDLRIALEVFAAGKAAKRITAKLLSQLSEHLGDMETIGEAVIAGHAFDPPRHEAMFQADAGIHETLLEAAQAPLVRKMAHHARVLSLISQRSPLGLRRQVRDMAANVDIHRRLVEAVRSRDAKAARRVMNEHLCHVKHEHLELFDCEQAAPSREAAGSELL